MTYLRERLDALGRPAEAVTVSVRCNVALGDPPPADRPTLAGDRASIQRDLDAYRAAGLDYLVANARQGRDADALASSMEGVARALRA